jgi:hypothetical protein
MKAEIAQSVKCWIAGIRFPSATVILGLLPHRLSDNEYRGLILPRVKWPEHEAQLLQAVPRIYTYIYIYLFHTYTFLLYKYFMRIYLQSPKIKYIVVRNWPPLWSSCQSFWLQIQRSRVRFPTLPDFLTSRGSGTGSTQPREDNWGTTWMKK